MIQIILSNVIKKNESETENIYQPETISKKLTYKMIFKSNVNINLNFILYANFIDGIEFNSLNKQIYYELISDKGLLFSTNISPNDYLEIKFKPIDLCTRIIIRNIKFNILQNICTSKFDNIFIINLQRRNDRKEQMIKKLFDANIKHYEFIEAYDGLDTYIYNQFLEIKKNTSSLIITSGHFACLLSHIKAIKLAKSRNYSNIMILEDDVYFCDNFLEKLSKLKLPQFDMIYLGGITSRKKLFPSNWCFCNDFKIMGAYGYILSSSIYNEVLTELEKLLNYVDFLFINQIQQKYKVILLDDFIKTDLLSSDTSHKSKKLIKRLKYIK